MKTKRDLGIILFHTDSYTVVIEKGMSGENIISIISTNLGHFGANSGITVGQSCSIRWYPSIFQKPHRFPRN